MQSLEEKPPAYWADTLNRDPPAQEVFLQLRPVINAHGRKWMQEFVEAQGLRKMLEAGTKAHFELKNEQTVLSCMQCLEGFMNNKVGLEFVMEDPQAIQDIAMFFNVNSIEVKGIVLKLLTVLTWIGDSSGIEGPVVRAFDNCRSIVSTNDNRFAPLVDSLRTMKDPVFRVISTSSLLISFVLSSCRDQ